MRNPSLPPPACCPSQNQDLLIYIVSYYVLMCKCEASKTKERANIESERVTAGLLG